VATQKVPVDSGAAKTIPASLAYGAGTEAADVQDNAFSLVDQWDSIGPYDDGSSVRGEATTAVVDSPGGRNLAPGARLANQPWQGPGRTTDDGDER
jgi:hypothetical protein